MIPALNIGNLGERWKRSASDELAPFRRPAEPIGENGDVAELLRIQPEGHSSTPLRSHGASKRTPRTARDSSPLKSISRGHDITTSADLRRRAEAVVGVLGVNVLQIQDTSLLQRKVIEVAERLLRAEEWYNGQLQERSSYFEHRLTQLMSLSGSGGASGAAPSNVEKIWTSPSIVRSRQSTAGAQLSRPALRSTSPSHPTERASTPTLEHHGRNPEGTPVRHSTHSASSMSAALRLSMLDMNFSQSLVTPTRHTPGKRRPKDVLESGNGSLRTKLVTTDNGRRVRRKSRSSSIGATRVARGTVCETNSGAVVEDENHHGRELSSVSPNPRHISRNAGGGTSTRNVSMSTRNPTPKRQRHSSSRLNHVPDTGKRD